MLLDVKRARFYPLKLLICLFMLLQPLRLRFMCEYRVCPNRIHSLLLCSGCNYIEIVIPNGHGDLAGNMSLLVDAANEEYARMARKHLDLHFKQRKRLVSAEAVKTDTLTKLYQAQGRSDMSPPLFSPFSSPLSLPSP